jgi:hypothetical protein
MAKPAPPRPHSLPMRARLLLPAALASTGAAALAPRPADAGPAAELWPRWEAHDPASTILVDHAAYGDLLDRYLTRHADGVNRVRYAALRADDRAALEAYVQRLEAVDPDGLNRPEQMAYWINFYNALTLLVVVEHYPVASIRDIAISPGLFSRGPWRRRLVVVNDEALSLDDIEHRILRPIWRDPRIHYAVNCASIGCPNLQPEPFTASRLEVMLERAATDYVDHPRGVAMVERTFLPDQLTASSIYDWFQADFGGNEAGVLSHMRRHATGETGQLLAGVEKIDAYRYDWRLNDSEG